MAVQRAACSAVYREFPSAAYLRSEPLRAPGLDARLHLLAKGDELLVPEDRGFHRRQTLDALRTGPPSEGSVPTVVFMWARHTAAQQAHRDGRRCLESTCWPPGHPQNGDARRRAHDMQDPVRGRSAQQCCGLQLCSQRRANIFNPKRRRVTAAMTPSPANSMTYVSGSGTGAATSKFQRYDA